VTISWFSEDRRVTYEETASKHVPTKKLKRLVAGVFILHQNLRTQNAALGTFIWVGKAPPSASPLYSYNSTQFWSVSMYDGTTVLENFGSIVEMSTGVAWAVLCSNIADSCASLLRQNGDRIEFLYVDLPSTRRLYFRIKVKGLWLTCERTKTLGVVFPISANSVVCCKSD
jgi:hypothetical protein